ncbi:hypothetical protein WA026_007118 [Henosepilachna vigintioctopunctata]|uniref:Proto-oncogene tyrosine-protein kinase receptor Ret n=1 Tax=Henosepilachna vigintioctopunctata TaxID=420089 RepID=A0AAW1V203_9CUCU
MTNMKMTFPLFEPGKYPNGSHFTSLYVQDSVGVFNFSLKSAHKFFQLTLDGELRFNEKLLQNKNVTGLDRITAEIIAKDSISTDSTTLQIEFLPLHVQDCDLIVEDLCFWDSVRYRVSENRPPTVLGSLADSYLEATCPDYKLNYTLKDDNTQFTLIPPTRNKTSWKLKTSKPLDRDSSTAPSVLWVKCVIENPQGTVREIVRNITVEVVDVDDNLPVAQEVQYHVSMPKNIVNKGHKVEHNKLILIDDDTVKVNKYRVGIGNDDLNMFKPICKEYPRYHNFERTMIHCKLEFVKDTHFESSTYSVELELFDENFVGQNKLVKVPIHIYFNNGSEVVPAELTRPFSRSLVLYPERYVTIFRTAGPFARVTQPIGRLSKGAEKFSVKTNIDKRTKKTIFNVTQTEGIVFIQDHIALSKAEDYVNLNISWWQNGVQDFDEVQVKIIDDPFRRCENDDSLTFCSEFDSYESCTHRNVCAIATGGYNAMQNKNSLGYHRCEWRGDIVPSKKITPMFSTCTPDSKTCPNGICDSLENLNDSICPQDCAVSIVFPTSRNPKTRRGIDRASGVCICNQLGACHCEVPTRRRRKQHVTTQTNSTPHPQPEVRVQTNQSVTGVNVTVSGLFGNGSKCGTFCIIGLLAGTFVIVAIVTVIVLCWRLHTVHKTVHQKYGDVGLDMAAPLTEYTRSDANGLNLPIQFDMTTSLTDKNLTNLIKKYEPDPKWEFPRNQLEIEQTLGEGEFGRVLRAEATNINGNNGVTTVAVKTLKDDARETELNDLLSEYHLLKEVSHPNVIKLLGVCTTPGGPIYLIIEYAEHGALRNYLRKSRNIRISHIAQTPEDQEGKTSHYDEPKTCQITPKEILAFAWQISNGMAYLSSVKLVHRDLAARNILLAKDKICKISDFGLTRDIYEDNAYFKRSKGRVPVKWMAPESLQDHIYTTKSDAWSFGILLWELVTLGASPYPGIAVQNLFHLLKQGYRMERPNNCSPKLYQMMRNCWEVLPENRPSFQVLSSRLEKMLGDGVEYIDLSTNVIQNKSYFLSPFEDLEDKPSNKLNYLEKSPSFEKCGETEKFVPQVVDVVEKTVEDSSYANNDVSTNESYETPVKVPKVLKTPSNEHPQYYTDMEKGSRREE